MNANLSFSLNWKEIDQILSEIDIENCFVQKITQPDFPFLLLELYGKTGRKKLLFTIGRGKSRFHLISSAIENKIKLQRFAQFLRSRIEGAKILSATQPFGERILKIELKREEEITLLWVRLWNNAPNIIATDREGVILDCFMRHPSKEEQSGKIFIPQWKENSPKENFPLRIFDSNHYPEIPLELITTETPYWKKIEWLANRIEKEEQFQKNKRQATSLCQKIIDQLDSKIEQLGDKIKKAENARLYQKKGELLLYWQTHIPKGATLFLASDYQSDLKIEIELDPKISIQKNSELYFKKYKKVKTSLEYLQEEWEQSRNKIQRFQKELIWIEQTGDEKLLAEWLNENHCYQTASKTLEEKNERQQKQGKRKEPLPGLSFQYKGFLLLVGRNGKENDLLLRKGVRGNDLWLHTRDYAGAYVFIKTIPQKSVPLEVLLAAGNLAIHYSKAKNANEADLYMTQVKYLRRAKEGSIGLVLPTQEKNLHVRVDNDLLKQLFDEK